MKRLNIKELFEIFISAMKDASSCEFKYENPFILKYLDREFYIYLKNITPAYFKNLPDITRVQIGFRNAYKVIINQPIPFVILGYDQKNDIFANWNPEDIKKRLNSKSNISLYSKRSLQDQVEHGEIMEVYNVNGDKQVFFKKELLSLFFDSFESIYSSTKKRQLLTESADKLHTINELTDPELITKIEVLLKENQILQAVATCRIHYGNAYDEMGFKDWFLLLTDFITKKESKLK